MTPVVACESVEFVFESGVHALQSINIRIEPGERVALLGSNGSGKSTLLRVMHGLLPPTRGSVVRDSKARQAMVFQRPFMLRKPALENVTLGLRLQGMAASEARKAAAAALERVGLAHVAEHPAHTLSGGQQQRVAMARAWALQPDVLLLDEPTASLDPRAKLEVEDLIAAFAASGMTVIFASHNLGQVKRLATRAVYLETGQLLADAPTPVFFDRRKLAELSPQAHRFVTGEAA